MLRILIIFYDLVCFLRLCGQIFAVDGFNISPIASQMALISPQSSKKLSFRKSLLTLPRRILRGSFAFSDSSLNAIRAWLIPITPYFTLLA